MARPHATEEEFLENELETLTRTSITLLGAQPRPQGLMLRFELALSTGLVLMRGEGRVVGYRPDAFYGMGGLTLRFTRLDSRSKAFADKAAGMRERRRPFASTASTGDTPSLAAPPIRVEDVIEDITGPGSDAAPSADIRAVDEARAAGELFSHSPPRQRDALLERLRARSRALNGDTVRKILERRR
ncbi:MAG: hypothetical protein M3O46_02325 [Myxococcota bacterium]|nr:hypothetical protein [Myxococcota bacterium]